MNIFAEIRSLIITTLEQMGGARLHATTSGCGDTLAIADEDAISGLNKPDVFSYTLDTGQTRQTVTRQSLSALQKTLDALYNRLAILEARCNGAGTIMRPGF